MGIISETFLVTIEIDTEKAKPFPNGFKDPKFNDGDNGYNWNSYPNWDINYQGNELNFLLMVWADFMAAFKYDGLKCVVSRVHYDN